MNTAKADPFRRGYFTETRGHVWKRDERGDVDIFAAEDGAHNGPVCTRCAYTFCHHCQEGPDEECVESKP